MAVRFLQIARFFAGQQIVSDEGAPTTGFLRALNDMIANIESAVNSIKQQTDDIEFSLQQAGIAITSAAEALAEARAIAVERALENSITVPNTVLSAADDPADATKSEITIIDHVRRYGDGVEVAVTGGVLSGVAQGKTYFITYTDAERTGGAVTYLKTSRSTDATQIGTRHLVGTITTTGGTPTTGGGPTGPGVPPGGGGGWGDGDPPLDQS